MKRFHSSPSWLALMLAMLVSPYARAADDYKGADAILTQIVSATGEPATAALSPAAQWLADVTAFRKKSSSLSPDQAARQWLEGA